MPGRHPLNILRRLINPTSAADFNEALAEAEEQRKAMAQMPAPSITEEELAEVDKLVWRLSHEQSDSPRTLEMAASDDGGPPDAEQPAGQFARVVSVAHRAHEGSILVRCLKVEDGYRLWAWFDGDGKPWEQMWLAGKWEANVGSSPPPEAPEGTEPCPILITPVEGPPAQPKRIWVWGALPDQSPLFVVLVEL